MEHLLSGLPWWNWVKTEVEELFAKERERLERLELARAKAAAPVVYQLLPTAQTGIKSGRVILLNDFFYTITFYSTFLCVNIQSYSKNWARVSCESYSIILSFNLLHGFFSSLAVFEFYNIDCIL